MKAHLSNLIVRLRDEYLLVHVQYNLTFLRIGKKPSTVFFKSRSWKFVSFFQLVFAYGKKNCEIFTIHLNVFLIYLIALD